MIDFGIVLETTASILLPVVAAAAIIMFSGFHRSCSNIVSTFSILAAIAMYVQVAKLSRSTREGSAQMQFSSATSAFQAFSLKLGRRESPAIARRCIVLRTRQPLTPFLFLMGRGLE